MINLLKFLSIGFLSVSVLPAVTACHETKNNNILTEFKQNLTFELNKTEFKLSEVEYKIEDDLKDQAQKVVNQLNQQEKYNFVTDLNVALASASEFNLFFFFYKTKDSFISSEIESLIIKLPYKK